MSNVNRNQKQPEQPQTWREWLWEAIYGPVLGLAYIGLLVFLAVKMGLSQNQGAAFVVGISVGTLVVIWCIAAVIGKRRRTDKNSA